MYAEDLTYRWLMNTVFRVCESGETSTIHVDMAVGAPRRRVEVVDATGASRAGWTASPRGKTRSAKTSRAIPARFAAQVR